MRTLTLPALLLALTAPAFAQDVVFEKEVLPILEKACFKCHSGKAKKIKSGLRLDGKGWILKGGNYGGVVAPGDAPGSSLYELVDLPKGDPDLMPPKGGPLPKAEIAILRRWIEQGAGFGDWAGVPGGFTGDETMDGETMDGSMTGASEGASPKVARVRKPAPLPPRVLALQALAEGVEPAEPQHVKAAQAAGAQLEPVLPGSPLLRVQFVSNEATITDASLKALAPLAGQIAHLNLAKTAVTDAGLQALAGMPRLTVLNLRKTGVGDAGLAHLSGLDELRSLNLYGTRVSDAGLPSLTALPRLQTVYVWQTEVSEAGASSLRAERPQLRVQRALALPQVREPIDGQRGRKRKKRKKR